MDKNTITGLILIGLLLIGFSYFSRPSEEQLAAIQQYNDSIAVAQERLEEIKAQQAAALANQITEQKTDSSALFHEAVQGKEEFITLSNEVVDVTFTTKGGRVYSALLHEYKDQEKEPLVLFDDEDVSINFILEQVNGAIQTKLYNFTPVAQTDSTLLLRLKANNDSYIDFNYKLNKDSYLVDFTIQAKGMAPYLSQRNTIDIEWRHKARQHERGFMYENRLSRLTYKIDGGDFDHLSESKNSEKEVEENLKWVAFKNQFFSSVLIADKNFQNSLLKSENEAQGSGYLKDYSANLATTFDPSGKEATHLYLYLGPNHYKTLKSFNQTQGEKWDLHDLIYLGWPIVKQINKWFTVNIFDWLRNLGLSMGVVLLLMTIIVKAVVFPATLKTFKSSAKMRVLKPKIDEINAKYPDQEDAMKKQQEVMGLYSQYGVSPMGGCLPMLLQTPIFMALFMFVPSAIELRQESFLWADDLSTYDAIINFPFHVPLLGDHLSLFCLLMTVTNILNMKFSMAQQDTGTQPQMAGMKWMMYLMPVMFLFILNDYPSGLCYYYFLSTLISVATMFVLRRMTDDDKLMAELEANKKDPKKKSGFAARLEAMQKEQERIQQAKNQKR